MVSVLRQLQRDWNDLVPLAQARGIRRVNLISAERLEPIAHRRAKLEWLRQRLGLTSAMTTPPRTFTISSPDSPVQAWETVSDANFEFGGWTFGVEMELIPARGQSMYSIAEAITSSGVPCQAESYNHRTRARWKIVTDASVAGGFEVVSPPLSGQDGFDQLRTVCEALVRTGAKVNKACGFHVHVGAAGQPVSFFRNLVKLYTAAQGHIDTFLSPSRRGSENRFCQPVQYSPGPMDRATTIQGVCTAAGFATTPAMARGGGRYRKLNLQSFWQHGTVEFRHHQGTVEYEKAANWVKFCLRMAIAAFEGKWRVGDFDHMMAEFKVSAGEAEFFRNRRDFFSRADARALARATGTQVVGVARPRRGYPTQESLRAAMEQEGLAATEGHAEFYASEAADVPAEAFARIDTSRPLSELAQTLQSLRADRTPAPVRPDSALPGNRNFLAQADRNLDHAFSPAEDRTNG